MCFEDSEKPPCCAGVGMEGAQGERRDCWPSRPAPEEGIDVGIHLVRWSIREGLWWEDPGRVGMGIYQILGRLLPVL